MRRISTQTKMHREFVTLHSMVSSLGVLPWDESRAERLQCGMSQIPVPGNRDGKLAFPWCLQNG